MATITEIALDLDVSSRWVSQLIAEGVLPGAPKGQHDLEACRRAYLVHVREGIIERSPNPPRERAAMLARLRKNGPNVYADDLEKNNGAETRGRYLPKAA